MLNKHRAFVKILTELCNEQSISVTPLCFDWVFKLEKNGKCKNIFGYDLGINSSVAQKISLDKVATYELLKTNNIPAVSHELFLEPDCDYLVDSGNWERLSNYLLNYKKIVCKPNNGQGGKDVFLVSSIVELEKVVHQLFIKNRAIALSPYHDIIDEYRIVILDNEILLVFKKIRQNGEWKHNLSSGAIPKIVEIDKINSIIKEIALKAVDVIGIVFAAVDIINTSNGYMVLEVNSGISLDYFVNYNGEERGYQKAKEIYRKGLSFLF
ncbi:MAG: ATP-grasp domain-containing protein [Candidatus Woesearchaeota archaeon]